MADPRQGEAASTTPSASTAIPAAALETAPREAHFEADEQMRAAIAQRLGVDEVKAFSGLVRLSRKGGDVVAEGRVAARLVRPCAVTLAAAEEVIDDGINLRLTAELTEEDERSAEDVDLLGPPFLVDGRLDVAEILVQQAALAMTPFPRAPDAAPEPAPGDETAADETAGNGRHRPFAALKEMMAAKPDGD